MSEIKYISVFKRLAKEIIIPNKRKLSFAMICMLIIAFASSYQVWLVKPALDKIFVAKNSLMLNYLPLIIVIVSIIRGVASYFQNYLMKYIGQRFVTDMQIKLHGHLLDADLAYLNNYSTGKIISNFTNDIFIIKNSSTNIIISLFRESITVVFLIILMFYQSFTLALIGFTVFPIAIMPILKIGKKMRKISAKTQDKLADFTSQLDDSFQLIKIIKSYCQQEYEKTKIANVIENLFKLYVKAIRTESFTSPIMESLGGIAIASVIWYGGREVILDKTSPGAFFSFIVAFITAYKPLKSLANLSANFQECLIAAKRIFSVLDVYPNIKNGENILASPIKGNIEFSQVSFTYPGGKFAIDNLSLQVKAGKTIAFVGYSGGGKTTLINLLLRFYDINSGKITIDDSDICDLNINSLRKNITLITQENLLFNDTIFANIKYANPEANYDEVLKAAKFAMVDDFAKNLPDGYDTIVGQYVLKLSGGQKQRIAIARAFLKNSSILILDEATSALDNQAEEYIQNSIKLLKKNKTFIIIAHRLSSIVNADLICLFRDGKIIESGTHQGLIEANLEYKKLYEKTKR